MLSARSVRLNTRGNKQHGGVLHNKGDKVLKWLPEILAVILMILAVPGLIHQQYATNDVWFHFHRLKNHETIVSCCVVAAIALVADKYLGKLRTRYG